MQNYRWSARPKRLVASLLATILVNVAMASSTRVVYSFDGSEGVYLDTELAMDASGNLYGTSVEGGDFRSGDVFQLAPKAHGWRATVLYSFTSGTDGAQPYKGVTVDSRGNLYGTAVTGGIGRCDGGCGVIYTLTRSGKTWRQKVIYSFTGGNDGSGPGSPMIFDKQGNLFGTAPIGGAKGHGVIYELKPNQDGRWKFEVIHAFTGGQDGAGGSAGRLLLDAKGNMYGVATSGGTYGSGTAYELSPTNGKWKLKTLYAFKGQPDAGFPYGGMVFDASGNLYGTTYYDGKNDLGAIYQLTPTASGNWKEKVLHSFAGGSDGQRSISTMATDGAGNLYGTTAEGGDPVCNCGVLFKMTPTTRGGWKQSIVHRFKGSPDGEYLYNGMVADTVGHFYGITLQGGNSGAGAMYEFTP